MSTAARQAVLERFLLMAERAGEWEGVNGVAKGLILRHARRDPDQTYRRLEGLVALWLAAQEEPDARRTDAADGAGARRRLAGYAPASLGADRRAAERPSRADAPAAGAVTITDPSAVTCPVATTIIFTTNPGAAE